VDRHRGDGLGGAPDHPLIRASGRTGPEAYQLWSSTPPGQGW
jgi:hypothetical protein